MRPLLVVKHEILLQPSLEFDRTGVFLEIDVFVFAGAPQ